MANPIGSITRRVFRGERKRILYVPNGLPYEACLKDTGHEFIRTPHQGEESPIESFDFDLVMGQSRQEQSQSLSEISKRLHLPFLEIETAIIDRNIQIQIPRFNSDYTIYNSNLVAQSWGVGSAKTRILHNATALIEFRPVSFEFMKIGYIKGDPPHPEIQQLMGDWHNKGLLVDCAETFENCGVLFNYQIRPSDISPLIESFAAGVPVISVDSPFVREYIVSGYNGFLGQNCSSLQEWLNKLMTDETFYNELRTKTLKIFNMKYNKDRFNTIFNEIVEEITSKPFLG